MENAHEIYSSNEPSSLMNIGSLLSSSYGELVVLPYLEFEMLCRYVHRLTMSTRDSVYRPPGSPFDSDFITRLKIAVSPQTYQTVERGTKSDVSGAGMMSLLWHCTDRF